MRLRHLYAVLIIAVGAIIVIGLRESTDFPDADGTREAKGAEGAAAGTAATPGTALAGRVEATEGVEKLQSAAAPGPGLSDEEIKRELERGREFRKQGRFETAITIFRRGLDKNPRKDAAHEFLFEVGQTQYQSAKKLLDRGASPEQAEPGILEALATFSSVIETYPTLPRAASASYMSGATHLLWEKPEKALEIFESTFERYPGYIARSRALLRVGMVLVVLDRIPEGVATFERVVREFAHLDGDVQTAKKYLHQLEIVGEKATPLGARAWLSGVVDDSGMASFEGEVIVLVFLATWCSSCSDEVPHLRRLIAEWSARGVVFLGALNPKDPMNSSVGVSVEDYAAKSGLEFLDVGLVENPRPWNAYRTERLPAAVVIDRRGIIRWRGHPGLFPDRLVTSALAE